MNYFNDKERLIENIKKLKCYKLSEVEQIKLQMKPYPQLLKEYKRLNSNKLKIIDDIKPKYYKFSLRFSNKDGSVKPILFDKASTNCHKDNEYNLPISLSAFLINEKLDDSEEIKMSSQLLHIYNSLLSSNNEYDNIKDKVRDLESKYFIVPKVIKYHCDNEKINNLITNIYIVKNIDIYYHYQDIQNNCDSNIENFRLVQDENLNNILKYNFNSIVVTLDSSWKEWVNEEKGNLYIQYEFPSEYDIINKKNEIIMPIVFK